MTARPTPRPPKKRGGDKGRRAAEVIDVGRRRITVSHPDKVLFEDVGATKLDLARYYEWVAPVMVPHVRDHPVAMQCFPDGVNRPGYYMKNIPGYFPSWISRATLDKRGGTITQVLAHDAATLVYLASQNCVTPHTWLSRADKPHHPDRLIFDLDPTRKRFAEVRAAARALGELLRDLDLAPFAMTTGSRGLHVVVPLRRSVEFDGARRFTRDVARVLAAGDPRRLTIEQRKEKRGERIFIDINRNAYAQHAAPPYAVRGLPRAPVAAPLHWGELDDRRLDPQRWTIRNLAARLRAEGDPWREIARHARALGPAIQRLSESARPA
ncbi:MAG TPA: non-homologous end-joining DNA ligase [Solirubrobacteraceae bacterium]|nr:non-homologous end-joining DNA ligase [Solirubrobacteraceae bacterium]